MLELADPDVLALVTATGVPEAAATATAASSRAALRSFDHAIAVVTDRAAFDALAADWTALDGMVEGATFFQSFAWCRAVFDHHQRYGRDFHPLVLTFRDRGQLLGLLPLQLKKSGLAIVAT